MAEAKLSRKKLSQAVRSALGEAIWTMKTEYSKDAGKKWEKDSYGACLAKAARQSEKPYSEAAFDCAEKYELGAKYASHWSE